MESVNIYSKPYWIAHLNGLKTVEPSSSIKEFAIKLFITREVDSKKAEEARQLHRQLSCADPNPPIFNVLKFIVSQEELVYSSRTVWRPYFFGIGIVTALFPLQFAPSSLKNRIALIVALFVSTSLAFYAYREDVKKISDLPIRIGPDIEEAINSLTEYTEEMAPRPREKHRPNRVNFPLWAELEEIDNYLASQAESMESYVLQIEQNNQSLGKNGFWDPRLSDMMLRRV